MTDDTLEYDEHPLFDECQLSLETLALRRLRDEMHRWLWTGATGALIFGTSRGGKTHAARALVDQLYTRTKTRIPAIYVSAGPRDQHTIAALYRDLCDQVHLVTSQRATADQLSATFVQYVADRAAASRGHRVALLVDEVQRLDPRQFNVFAEIYDKLLLLDITVLTAFFASEPGCWDLVKAVEAPKYAHIRGRFFRQGHAFRGLTSQDELRFCLAQYDTLRQRPDGPTYVEFFLPDAVRDGWHVADLSRDLWRTFRQYQREYDFDSWPMGSFVATIGPLLTDFLPRYGVEAIDDNMLDACIRVSGLIPSLVCPQ